MKQTKRDGVDEKSTPFAMCTRCEMNNAVIICRYRGDYRGQPVCGVCNDNIRRENFLEDRHS